jgi:uncharacterized protein YwqG
LFFRNRKALPKPSDKQVSVILKRQVPIRFDETARSWLGGLPMMPRLAKWPRDKAGAPLHFVAQIACGDLPAQLWNGLGPRKGWLLLFVETIKLEDDADGGLVQVMHTTELGQEQEPPTDAPTVRHTMSDYIDYSKPTIRPGVPKLWRKWPVDLVVQEYDLSGGDEARYGPRDIAAEDLYGAPVSDKGVLDASFDLRRPLTWRGALYVIEGLRRDLAPDDFKRNFVGNLGLLEPPESDQNAYNAEFQRRVAGHPACADRDVGWGPRVKAITDSLEAELKAERRTGWMMRAFLALEVVKARSGQWRDKYQQDIDQGGDALDATSLQRLRGSVAYHTNLLAELEEHRAYLNGLLSAYPGAAGEEAFNTEIREMGEAHLAWGVQMASMVARLLKDIQAQNLDTALPEDDWSKIIGAVKNTTSTYWAKTGDTRVLAKVERSLSFRKHVDMAIREDLLDLYTRSKDTCAALPAELIADLEPRLRYVYPGLPHRMGGQANPVQGEADASTPLLFQIASDRPMGWMWGDVGALYVTVSPDDLRRNRFNRLEAWIEGH